MALLRDGELSPRHRTGPPRRRRAPATGDDRIVGLTAFVFPPVLQGRVIAAAGAAPLLAAALNISAFNIANAVGAGVGGALIDADMGLRAPSPVSAVAAGLVTAALLLAARPKPCTQPCPAG